MRSYGQYCPIAQASEILAERWTPLVLREMLAGSHRFNDILRGVPRMSSALLSKRLSTLARAGVVEARPRANGNGKTYHLTQAGRELGPLIEQMGVWGERWVRREIGPEDADPSLIMWDLRGHVALDQVPDRRVVVFFHFDPAPRGYRTWWLVIEAPEVELCLTDPGFPVDLTVHTDPTVMAQLRIGDTSLSQALRAGTLTLTGPTHLTRQFRHWFHLSQFATVNRARTGP